jgi:hypothetical protein
LDDVDASALLEAACGAEASSDMRKLCSVRSRTRELVQARSPSHKRKKENKAKIMTEEMDLDLV